MSRTGSNNGLGLYGLRNQQQQPHQGQDMRQQQRGPVSSSSGKEDVEYLLGIHEFRARSEDELSLKKGDHIQVLETDKQYGDGWYIGRNLTTNETGLFPKVFTTTLILPPSNQPKSENRSRSNSTAARTSSNMNYPPQQKYPEPNQQTYFRSQLSTPQQHYGQTHSGSVHDTLTDIDEAISELNRQQEEAAAVEQLHEQLQNSPSAQQLHSSPHLIGGELLPSEFANIQNEPGMPSFDNIPEWTPYEVQQYFEARGYERNVSDQFVHHRITGSILLEMELAYLKEIDIMSFGTRFEISKDIKYLNSVVKRLRTTSSGAPSVNGAASPAQIRRQSIGHQFTRSTSKSGGTPPTVSARSSSLRSSTATAPEQVHNSSSPKHVSSPQQQSQQTRTRKPSFDRNWSHPGIKRSVSSSTSDSGYVASNPQTPTVNESTIPEDSPVTDPVMAAPPYQQYQDEYSHEQQQHQQQLSSSSIGSGRKSSYVERQRMQHAREDSRETIRAARFDEQKQHTRQRSSSSTGYEFKFLKRHSHSGSDVQLHGDLIEDEVTRHNQHKRRSSMFGAVMGNGGYGSQPSSPYLEDENYGYASENPTATTAEDLDQLSTPMSSEPMSSASASANGSAVSFADSANESKKDSAPAQDDEKKKGGNGVSFGKMKTLRQATSQHNLRRPLTKQNTSAFLEGIRTIKPEEASKNADYSGWIQKRGGGTMGTWKSRYFTLHGTRLSYYTSMNDTRERGLIDITAHRVLPAKDDDKLIALHAASFGAGRHVFKLVPPAPGSKKGVMFTAPKLHYFAVDTRQEMRAWMAALMKATIDRDESVPALSSCATPTVSLPRAQELFAEARARDEDLRSKMIAGGLNNMPNANAAAAAAAQMVKQGQQMLQSSNGRDSDPDSPGSSLRSSRTGSSATNSSLLRGAATVSSATTSPKDYNAPMMPHDAAMRHLTTKTAGLKVVTDLEQR